MYRIFHSGSSSHNTRNAKMIPKRISSLPIVWECRKLALYSISTVKSMIRFRNFFLIGDAFKYFPTWWKYQQKNNEPLKNDFPWIVFEAAEYLRRILHKDMVVFEYGSGSSTLFFSRRVSHIFSMEHDSSWYNHLSQIITDQKIKNVDHRLIECMENIANKPSEYLSSSTLYKGKCFESYVKSIDAFPDHYFDVVLVDGRSRNACIAHAKDKVKQGGYLIVDNSDREYYLDKNDFLRDTKEWNSIHFIGPVPYSFEFSRTSFFQKL